MLNSKIICITNKIDKELFLNITIGKTYQIIFEGTGNRYWINDDNQDIRGMPLQCFQTVEDSREQKLNYLFENTTN